MQSTKYLLLLLAVLAVAAMDVAECYDRRCQHIRRLLPEGLTQQKCRACCILLGQETNFDIQYVMAANPWLQQGKCECERSTLNFIPNAEQITQYFNLLGSDAPKLDFDRPATSHVAPGA
jgi:hypothetical protein